jgi:hypothetical protein
MACELTRGKALDCKDIMGGVKNLYFAQHGDLTITHTNYSSLGGITQIAGAGGYTAGYYKYGVAKGQASYTENVNSSMENGTTFFQAEVNIKLHKLSISDRNEIKLLAQNRLIIFVELNQIDNSTGKNEIYAVGVEHGAELSAGVIQSGAGAGDLNGYDLTFTAMESFPALKLDAYSDTPFDNFTLTTVVE